MKNNPFKLLYIFLIASIFIPRLSFAQGDLHFQAFRGLKSTENAFNNTYHRPYSVSPRYDTNIYLTDHDLISDLPFGTNTAFLARSDWVIPFRVNLETYRSTNVTKEQFEDGVLEVVTEYVKTCHKSRT